ncbi:MAG: hypothetical protein ACTHWH_09880 [Marinobacter sp.]
MPFICLDSYAPHNTDAERRLGCEKPEHLSIRIETDSLIRLLKARQLHVENFSCADLTSKSVVHNLLLEFALKY